MRPKHAEASNYPRIYVEQTMLIEQNLSRSYLVWVQELLEVRATQPAVPVVRNVAPVHDLPEEVAEVLPGNLAVRLQVVEQDVHADGQVA